jgi:hypothetical protein
MSDQQLCDLLNEFYEDIRPDLVELVFLAIKAAHTTNEFIRPELFESIRTLILNLANPQQDDSIAINTYMADNNTRGSSTRPFFYHMTLPGNLNPEENIHNINNFHSPSSSQFHSFRVRHRPEDFLSQPQPDNEPFTFFPPIHHTFYQGPLPDSLPPLGGNLTSLALFQTYNRR